jgi:hypothetical protein
MTRVIIAQTGCCDSGTGLFASMDDPRQPEILGNMWGSANRPVFGNCGGAERALRDGSLADHVWASLI